MCTNIACIFFSPYETRFLPQIDTTNKKDVSDSEVTKKENNYLFSFFYFIKAFHKWDRLCGLVVRIPGYRSRGPGSIPITTRFSEQ
jgi:hypothetical protein